MRGGTSKNPAQRTRAHNCLIIHSSDWPRPIDENMIMAVVLKELAFSGDTRSRLALLVFAQANQSRFP